MKARKVLDYFKRNPYLSIHNETLKAKCFAWFVKQILNRAEFRVFKVREAQNWRDQPNTVGQIPRKEIVSRVFNETDVCGYGWRNLYQGRRKADTGAEVLHCKIKVWCSVRHKREKWMNSPKNTCSDRPFINTVNWVNRASQRIPSSFTAPSVYRPFR